MDGLLGGLPDALRFVVAFLVVLGLIGVAALLWRRFNGLSVAGPHGRQPRLAVIDAASVDGRRRLVLIRRDNTEHLLMIGGPTDIVIEPGIVRASPNGDVRDARSLPLGELARQKALPEGAPWPLVDAMPRPARMLESADPLRPEAGRQDPLRSDPLRADPLRPDPLRPDPLRPDATRLDSARLPREAMAEPPRPSLSESEQRPTPPSAAERVRNIFHQEADTASASMPADDSAAGAIATESRRIPAPPGPAYEPVFQTSPVAETKRPSAEIVEPPAQAAVRAPAPVLPPYEPAFQAPAEAPRPPVAPVPSGRDVLREPGRDPAFESTVIRDTHRLNGVAPRPSQSDENNLAEMAQRLEAALRRPTRPVEPLAPPPPLRVAQAPAAPPVSAPVPPAAAPAPMASAVTAPAATVPSAAPPVRATPRFEPSSLAARAIIEPPVPRAAESVAVVAEEVRPPATPERTGPPATLESEFANLLGRPPGKT